jgi:hypothetical protein
MNINRLNVTNIMLAIVVVALVLWFLVVVRPWWIEGQGMRLIGGRHMIMKEKTRIAPRSSEKEDSPNLKPFVGNPAGNQSRPEEPGQQPEASLAWWVGNCPCEA